MHLVPKTSPLSELAKRPGDVLALMEDGPVLLLSRSTPAGLLIQPKEWNRIVKRLELLEDLQEARRIKARNDANDSWISSEEMRERMAKHGVFVES